MIRKGMEGLSGEERAQREAFLNQMPLITPEEIADAVMEFVQDDSLNGEAMGDLWPPPANSSRPLSGSSATRRSADYGPTRKKSP